MATFLWANIFFTVLNIIVKISLIASREDKRPGLTALDLVFNVAWLFWSAILLHGLSS